MMLWEDRLVSVKKDYFSISYDDRFIFDVLKETEVKFPNVRK